MEKKTPKLQTFVDLNWIYNGNDDLKLKHYEEALKSLMELADKKDEPARTRIYESIKNLREKLEE